MAFPLLPTAKSSIAEKSGGSWSTPGPPGDTFRAPRALFADLRTRAAPDAGDHRDTLGPALTPVRGRRAPYVYVLYT